MEVRQFLSDFSWDSYWDKDTYMPLALCNLTCDKIAPVHDVGLHLSLLRQILDSVHHRSQLDHSPVSDHPHSSNTLLFYAYYTRHYYVYQGLLCITKA